MMNFIRKRMNKKGFTLIELIVVIAILGILAAIAIPRLAGFTESARQANDEEIAAIVANAGAMYAASHQEMAIADLADAIEDQSGMVADGTIDAVYADTDLESEEYTAITINYVEDATEAATETRPIGTTVVTLTAASGTDFIIAK